MLFRLLLLRLLLAIVSALQGGGHAAALLSGPAVMLALHLPNYLAYGCIFTAHSFALET